MAASPLGTYHSVQVATADPASLVVQLFDGALRFLGRARRALATGNQGDFAFAVTRAHAIVAELSNVLDRDAGGEIAQKLDLLYDFALRHLTEGMVRRSDAHLARVTAILETLREAFDAARRQ